MCYYIHQHFFLCYSVFILLSLHVFCFVFFLQDRPLSPLFLSLRKACQSTGICGLSKLFGNTKLFALHIGAMVVGHLSTGLSSSLFPPSYPSYQSPFSLPMADFLYLRMSTSMSGFLSPQYRLSLIWLPPCWPLYSSSNTPSMALPQDLCTGSSFCMGPPSCR